MAIATVVNVKGEVFAVNKEGVKRRLQKGDQLQEGEILVTAPGSTAELDMGGGKTVQVAEQQTFAVDGSVGGPAQPSATTSAIESAAAAQKVIQALAAGDANALLEAEAAAAGLAGGGAADGGSSFVQLLRISEGVTGVGYEYGSFSQGAVDQPTPGAIEEIITEVEEPEQPQEPEELTRALVSIEGPGEVVEGDITSNYTLSVDQPTTADLVVTLTYTGIALDGTDFTSVVQVTIPSGSSSVTFNIATLDDNLDEGSELYTVTITGVSGGGFDMVQIDPTANHVDTAIVDEVEDQTPQEALVSIAGPGSVAEGSTTTNYTVSVDQQTTDDLIVTLTYTGVALDGTDFTGVAEVTIPSGSSSVTFNIATLVDDIAEGSELYTVTITDVSGGGFELVLIDPAADHVDTNILDDDFAPVGNPDLREVREGSVAASLATVLSNDTDADDVALTVAVFSATNSGSGSTPSDTSTITTALGGTVKMNSDGSFTYTAPVRDHGIDDSDSDGSDRDYFYYKASDGTNLSGWVLVNIDITDTGVDAIIDIQALPTSGPLVGNVLANDTPSLDTPTKVTSVNGTPVPTTGNVSINGTYGVLTINSDGVYTYTKNSEKVITSDGVDSTHPAGVTMYATESWSDLKGNTISTGSLTAWDGVDELSGSKPGFGVKFVSGAGTIDNNEALIVTLDSAANSVSVQLGQINAQQGDPEEAHWYAYDINGSLIASGDFSSAFNSGILQPLMISSTTEIKYLVFSNEGGTNSQGFDVTSITYQPSGVDSFTYTITDSDGSTDSSVLLIGDDQIVTGTGGDDAALLAGIGDDILVGGTGSDHLTGGLGDDVFVWRSGDQGTGGTLAVDTIADFGNGTDKIDLRDLLQGENSGNLTDYLHFAYDSTTQSTIINISTTGDVDTAVDQQIVLAAVDITNEGALSDAMIIANLLSQQKLVVDS